MSVELHLPDLPEVPVSVGAQPGRPRRAHLSPAAWLRELFGASLPLFLMALLAIGTWWLVKTAPQAPRAASGPIVPRHDPDYQLEGFTVERFLGTGELGLTLRGRQLRHYPDTDELEIELLNLDATAPKGTRIEATARQARVSGKADQVELQGGASVTSTAPGVEPVQLSGEQLRVDIRQHRVVADKPVRVRQGSSEFSAAALEFDGVTRQLILNGPARVELHPQALPARAKR